MTSALAINSRFAGYQVPRLTGGVAHPASMVETKAMSGIIPPPLTARLQLPYEVAQDGLLSVVQLERVAYAVQAHAVRLASGARAGFMVGDGTGVGKGRVLAGVILHYWHAGIRRALWLSASNELCAAARQDFNDLTATDVPVRNISEWGVDQPISLGAGVIFATYSSLIATSRDGKTSRFEQLTNWLQGEDGQAVIIIDESQKAKNAVGETFGNTAGCSQTGVSVLRLQDEEKFPDFRVVYSSATGYTELRNMAYLCRLGLWGKGTAFPDFAAFQHEIGSAGISGMELVARDLRARGLLCAANLSYEGVEYQETTHQVTPEQEAMYDRAAEIWLEVSKFALAAMDCTNGSSLAQGRMLAQFWAAHQRFFSLMLLAFKVPTLIQQIEEALAAGLAPIITLQNTGEARTKMAVSRAVGDGDSLAEIDLTPRQVLGHFIENAFPVIQMIEIAEENGKRWEPLLKNGQPVVSREAMRLREKCLALLSGIYFPGNPLDDLVNHFGGSRVAEISGRKKRLCPDEHGRLAYRSRAPAGVPMKRANEAEMAAFMRGDKLIAIITPAGNEGISLHASRRAQNQRRRLHIIPQFGWSADKTIQGMGRSHRSNQESPPLYNLLATDVAGEVRFRSSVAKRIAQLGALTRGDRAAADGSGLANYNYESQQGRDALLLTCRKIIKAEAPIKVATLLTMGIATMKSGAVYISDDNLTNIGRFLNRMLCLPIKQQNAFFAFYLANFQAVMETAREQGLLDLGIEDVRGEKLRSGSEPQLLAQDASGAVTVYYHLVSDVPVQAVTAADIKPLAESGKFDYYRNTMGHLVMVTVAGGERVAAKNGMIYQYHMVSAQKRWDRVTSPTLAGYEAVNFQSVPDFLLAWEQQRQALPPTHEAHSHVIAGVVLPLWNQIKTKDEQRLRILKAKLNGASIVGVKIPNSQVRAVLDSVLSLHRPGAVTGDDVFSALEQGGVVALQQGFGLKQIRLKGQEVIEITNLHRAGLLPGLPVVRQIIDYRNRFFLPLERTSAVAQLNLILASYPVVTAAAVTVPERSATITIDNSVLSVEELFGRAKLAGQVASIFIHRSALRAGKFTRQPELFGWSEMTQAVA